MQATTGQVLTVPPTVARDLAVTEAVIPLPRWKQARRQVMAGGAAGFVEVCCMHPLDVAKTRIQLQRNVGSSNSSQHYASLSDCFRKMYRTEGPMSFYKGILPPILAETPKRATKFVCFEQYKQALTGGDSSRATPVVYALAGLGSGLTEGLVITPFEVVKISLQAQRSRHKDRTTTFRMAGTIVQENGFRGMYKGLTATLGRHGVWNCVYFFLYNTASPHLPAYDEQWKRTVSRLAVGLCAGAAASVANIPWDVAKSRIQGPQPEVGVVKYSSTLQTMRLVVREEGFWTLYRGLLPKILRLGPGGAIMLVVYENVCEWLKDRGL